MVSMEGIKNSSGGGGPESTDIGDGGWQVLRRLVSGGMKKKGKEVRADALFMPLNLTQADGSNSD